MRYTLTVFREDDTTPWFEVGTDPSHPAPYLHEPGEIDAGEVDFLRGTATIGQVNLRVIDVQTGASQAERWLTERLGIPAGEEGEGHTALIGRRALLLRDGDVVLDGVVYSVTLSESFAGFHLQLRDIRERERKAKLFTRSGTATVLPRGVLNGYGRLPSGGWLIPPTTPLRATFRWFLRSAGRSGYFDLSGLWRGNPLSASRNAVAPANLVVTEAMRRACRSVSSSVEILPGVILTNVIRYPDVQIWWRPAGGGSWTVVNDILQTGGTPHGLLLNTTQGRLAGANDTTVEAVYSIGVSTLQDTLPSDGQQVDVMVVYVGPPSEDYPLHIETTAGQLLQDIYDGVYSDDPLGVRYDPAALAALTTPVRLRITEPVDDARRWLEKHVYRALGAAPALDPQGRVSPVRAALPDPDAVLPVIDDDSAQAIPGWEHRADNAVTVVRVTYPRDYRVPAEQDPTGEHSAGDGIASREVIIERRAPEWAIALMGEQVHEIDGSIFRALGGPDGEPVTGDVTDETGAQIALARAHETLDRWVFGGQISTCRIRAADFPGLRVGDWVIDARSWRPNYWTRQRGGQTLAQIMAIRSADPAWLDVTLVDAGPAEQPVQQPPTLGALSVNDDGVVSVPVTAVPVNGEAAVYYAISSTQPAPTSGLWTFLGRLSAPGTLQTPPLPAGVTVWVRARGEALGRRPSQYTTPVSIVVTLTPRVSEVRLQVTDHTPTVTWQRNAAAAGVRIYYAVHDPAATPTLSASIDVAATAGAATIPAVVPSGQAVTVEVEPWTGWTGSTVTGTAGPRVRASAAVEPDTIQILPPRCLVRVYALSDLDATIQVTGVTGEGGAVPTQYAWRSYNEGVSPPPAFSTWANLDAQKQATFTVDLHPRRRRVVDVKVRTASGLESDISSVTVPPGNPFQGDDGLIRLDRPYSGSTLTPQQTHNQALSRGQNLLGPDAGPEKSGTGSFPFSWLSGSSGTLNRLGLQVGDVISGSAELRSADAGQVVLRIEARNASAALLASVQSVAVASTTYQRATANGLTIPSGTAFLVFQVQRLSGNTGQAVFGRRAMLNRGPVALPFEEPPLRPNRETLADVPGPLREGTGMLEGQVIHQLFRHGEVITIPGSPLGNGKVTVSFGQLYEDAPAVALAGFRGLTYKSGIAGDQRLVLQAEVDEDSLTSTAQIVSISGTTTSHENDFAPGNALVALAAWTAANISPGGAIGGTYTVHYSVSVTASAVTDTIRNSVNIKVAIETWNGATWTERAVYPYGASTRGSQVTNTWPHEIKQIVASGTVTMIRLLIKEVVEEGDGGGFTVHGFDGIGDPAHGVTYQTADTVETPVSAIPAASDFVKWIVKAIS